MELRSMRSLLNVRQVANIIGSYITAVRRYEASGKLASIPIGNPASLRADCGRGLS